MAISRTTGSKYQELMKAYVDKAVPGLAYMASGGFGFDDGCEFISPLDRATSFVEMAKWMRIVHERKHDKA